MRTADLVSRYMVLTKEIMPILHERHTGTGQCVMITAFNALYSTPFAVVSGTITYFDPHIKT